MDNTQINITAGGLYVRGVVVSSQANAFQRKDGSGVVVKVTHEIATQPGLVVIEQYLNPKETAEVKVEGVTVLAYPKMEQLQAVTFKVLRYRCDKERLVITQVETMAQAAKK
jgi:hypothetical protein